MPHDEKGREIPDPTPVEIPAGISKPESMNDMIRRYVRIEASKIAEANDMETFEEADDFEVDDMEPDDQTTVYMVPEVGPDGPESLDGEPDVKPPADEVVQVETKTEASTDGAETQQS